MIDLVNRSIIKICVTPLRYIINNWESSYAHIRLSAKKKEDEKFQQTVFVEKELKEFIYLLDVMNSVHDKAITNEPFFIIPYKVIATFYSSSFFLSQDELEHWS